MFIMYERIYCKNNNLPNVFKSFIFKPSSPEKIGIIKIEMYVRKKHIT